MSARIVGWVLAAVALGWPWLGSAHQGGIELSGLEIVAQSPGVEVWVHMHAHTLQPVAPMDDDKNGIINEAEARAHIHVWQAYIGERLTLRVNGALCAPTPGEHELAMWNQILHAQMHYTCPEAWGALEVDNRLLWEQPERHRFLLSVLAGGEESNVMHDEKKRRSTFSLGPPPAGVTPRNTSNSNDEGEDSSGDSGLWSTLWVGMEHILYGLDHVLFVLLLLVATRQVGPLLAQITAFTVSHSLTLLLAAYEVIVLPSWLVESVIAASILVVAVDNIWRTRRDEVVVGGWQRPALAFGFGLVHGLGFASALGPLGADAGLVWLLGFNLGVEAGQLVVVLAVWPLLRLGMKRAAYPNWLRAVSAVCGVVAVWWLVERLQGA